VTQHALGAGASIPRKRVMFGLLDADGWGWASIKAFLWVLIIIFMLGYLPDRAYYFTVGRTVDLGVLVWAPINACPPSNEALPCPPPTGAVIPWQPSPEELRLPQPRTGGSIIQNGTTLMYIGGSDGAKAVDTVYVSQTVGTGNFDKWTEGPALPEPRSGASVAFVAGNIYVLGGRDGAGVPSDTIFFMDPDPKTGELKPWKTSEVKLPEGRADAAGVVSPTGLLLIGGSNADGPVSTTWKSEPTADGALGEWEVEAPLLFPQTNATAAVVGDYVWLYGGSDANGPVGAVQRAEFGRPAIEGLPDNPDEGKVIRWAVNNDANLPEPRTEASGWTANGAIYLVGGADKSGPKNQLYWAIPTSDGNIPEWFHLDVSDLPAGGLAGGAPVILGPDAILVGGTTDTGVLTSSVRANTAPQSPFFSLGILGAVIPGLKLDGEIGQQLGYLAAAGVGTANFILLIFIGYLFAHKAQTAELLHRLRSRRRK
jgi:N-acetylneuraminic acid mutarotase